MLFLYVGCVCLSGAGNNECAPERVTDCLPFAKSAMLRNLHAEQPSQLLMLMLATPTPLASPSPACCETCLQLAPLQLVSVLLLVDVADAADGRDCRCCHSRGLRLEGNESREWQDIPELLQLKG